MSNLFEELSQEMSTEERKNLLSKIQSSLNLGAKDTDSIINTSDTPEQLRHRLLREFRQLGWLERFFLSIWGFFTSRADYEVMGQKKLSETRQIIQEQIPSFINFGRSEWTPEFAKTIYDLYADVSEARPIFEHLFLQKFTLEASLVPLIQENYSEAITGLEDLFPEDDIIAIYRKEGRLSKLFSELDKRIDAYWQEIPGSVFDHVRDLVRPIYFLKPLAFFPFAFLFELFKHTPERGVISKYPAFLSASWKKSGGLFERLYYGLYLVSKVESVEGLLPDLLSRVASHLSDEKSSWTEEQVRSAITNLHRRASHLVVSVPWREVLRWAFQDPYYSVKFKLPQFSVADFYRTTIEMSLREELEERLPSLRQELLSQERSMLFRDGEITPLEYYVPGVGSFLGVGGTSKGFRHPESLSLLWGFLSSHFTPKIVPFFQSLLRLAPLKQRTALQPLTQTVEILASLGREISQLDQSLHPDTEQGKEFARLKYELGNRALSQKPFFDLLEGKDRQAEDILRRGTEAVDTLLMQLKELKERNVPALQSLFKLPYLLDGQQESVENGMERVITVLQKIQFIMKEAQNLET